MVGRIIHLELFLSENKLNYMLKWCAQGVGGGLQNLSKKMGREVITLTLNTHTKLKNQRMLLEC